MREQIPQDIAKQFRIEEPLAVLIRKAREAIQPFIRERQQLHDLFFIEKLDRAGCYPPRFEIVGGFVFEMMLRNEPICDRKTLEWLKQFADVELSGDQKRMLVYAHAHAHGDRFTSREFQKVIETDIYGVGERE